MQVGQFTIPVTQHVSIPLLGFIPVVEPRWTFYLLPRLSAYFKLGIGVPLYADLYAQHVTPGFYVNPAVGAVFALNSTFHLRADVGLSAVTLGLGLAL
jgi:hypothetical protein